ncbi:CpsB/CapC family capsule biosynthesis tyrosine phosphatase [Myroides sp. DF42-4-2]|uniref:tyrosine-protein phosphatase n=1 Tax=unclassified Myroides TaxID=2642485 RepID=UPI002575EABC|nr:CpsB/CapC family capsule biosynthesis tyrosine phosphatase [Myroides sp. DF42-4-2]MDM1407386.1 histidinol phosphatase [Myroides sp. DF42-4-2]
MFSFFKSKPILKDLIPDNYVDIHSHLIYGIDDGAQTIEDTRTIIKAMQQMGFDQAIATPHTTPLVWENTREGILNQYKKVQEELPTESKAIELRVASEYMMDETLLPRIENKELLTLKKDYVLVEMSYMNPPIQLMDILFQLKSNGYDIVLAHPERYNFYHQNTAMYKKLKKAGCLFQMNLLSATGYYGKHVLEAANFLLSNGLIDFVGSDIHHEKHIKGFEAKVEVKGIEFFTQAISNNQEFRK